MIFLHLRLACLIKLKIKSELKLIFKQYFKRERERERVYLIRYFTAKCCLPTSVCVCCKLNIDLVFVKIKYN